MRAGVEPAHAPHPLTGAGWACPPLSCPAGVSSVHSACPALGAGESSQSLLMAETLSVPGRR